MQRAASLVHQHKLKAGVGGEQQRNLFLLLHHPSLNIEAARCSFRSQRPKSNAINPSTYTPRAPAVFNECAYVCVCVREEKLERWEQKGVRISSLLPLLIMHALNA
jgi:hypothetical protein